MPDEHVGPNPGFGPVVDRAQVQVDALEGAEVSFPPGTKTCTWPRPWPRPSARGEGGADDVDPVQGRLGSDGVLVAGEREPVVGDVQDVVLGHLVPADDLPDPGSRSFPRRPDAPATTAATILASSGRWPRSSARRLRGRALRQAGLRARDQAFSGVVGGRLISARLGLVEQGHSAVASAPSRQGGDGGGGVTRVTHAEPGPAHGARERGRW